jgi:hypothetical protein
MGSRYHGQPEKELVDFRNNVIYNWGRNSSYGGEAGNHNLVANYYKSGPASKRKNRIVEPWDEDGRWFVEKNYVYGYPEITADNWAGGVQGDYVDEIRTRIPFIVEKVNYQDAETAFDLVLHSAGATIPKRDTVDKRIVTEVRLGEAQFGAGKHGIIDSQQQVGGWPVLNSTDPPQDSDMDGIPDNWEILKELDTENPKDSNNFYDNGSYTNLEIYLNELASRAD